MSADELETLIKRAVHEESQKAILPPEKDKYLSRKEAKNLMHVKSDTSMIAYERRGLINPCKIGKKVMYRECEILEALKKFERA
jgi:hypothetical protein